MKDSLILREAGKDPMYKIWHASSRALFLYVHTGTGSVVTKDRNYPIEQRALILIPPGTYHYTMPEEPERYVRSKLILSPSKYLGILELLRASGEPFPSPENAVLFARIPPELEPALDRGFAETAAGQTDGEDAASVLAWALRLISFLKKHTVDSAAPAAGVMSKAIAFINENISRPLELDTVCAAVGMSKYYFCRQFKLQLGVTVMQYILRTRIVVAKEMLNKTDLPITRISEACGFGSVSYFCQAFKAETGLTPLQYRKTEKPV